MRMIGCYECAQTTSGDCGRHGPIVWPQEAPIAASNDPEPASIDALWLLLEQARATIRYQSAALQVVTQERDRLAFDKDQLTREWSIMARACGNYRSFHWDEAAQKKAADMDEQDWKAAAGLVLKLKDAEHSHAVLVEQIRALPRFGGYEINPASHRKDWISGPRIDALLTEVSAGADPAAAQTE